MLYIIYFNRMSFILLLLYSMSRLLACSAAQPCKFDASITCPGQTPAFNPTKYHIMARNNMNTTLLDPQWARFVDKILFKDYCAAKGVRTIPTIQVFDQRRLTAIDLATLPADFVIKSNKVVAHNIIVKNYTIVYELDEKLVQSNFTGDVRTKQGQHVIRKIVAKWHWRHGAADVRYDYIKPQIIVENLLGKIVSCALISVQLSSIRTLVSSSQIHSLGISKRSW